MKRKLGIAATVAASGAILLAAACGGDDDGGGVPTPPGGEDSTSVVADITPFPTPLIEGREVTSDSKGYAATMPEGWRPRVNYLQTTDGSVDAFFEPLPPNAVVQANITVLCISQKAEDSEENITAEKTITARVGLNENIQESTATVNGQPVTVLSYIATSQANPDQPRLAKSDYLFSGPKCDYKITTTAAEADKDKYQPQFDGFISSFRLLD